MTWEGNIVTLILACCATAHFAGMCITGILARHRVQYHSLAAMLGIFFCVITIVACFGEAAAHGKPGLLNPYMIWMLVVGVYMQSLYSLGLMMPGYLEWGRMFRYASPIILLAVLYVAVIFPDFHITRYHTGKELFDNILSLDVLWRIATLLLGIYYALNIFILPRRLAHKTVFPVSVLTYIVVLLLSMLFYLYTAVNYNPTHLCAYIISFTVINFFWVCHSMEELVKIPVAPVTTEQEECTEAKAVLYTSPTCEGEQEDDQEEDFNELNRQRYVLVQTWMHHNRDKWTTNGFTRDLLCRETGINRQLMLQCLRSQGHYNVHEYITTYRVHELKRLIVRGEVNTLADTLVVGFGSIKTARQCFERIEGLELDEYLAHHARRAD